MHLIHSLRVHQWVKNLVVFAPVVFAVRFMELESLVRSVLALIILCLLSSGVYLLNDIRDRTEDVDHPTKRFRPIASGRMSVSLGYLLSFMLIGSGLTLSFFLGPLTTAAALGFLLVNAIYTYGGKNVPILDVMLIGASFVVRVLVGAAAILVPASAWLLLTLFFLATYLGFTKRSAEIKSINTSSRVSLKGYAPDFLDHARSATLALTLGLYTLYTFVSPFGEVMALTVPFVFFGLLRYQAIADADTGKNDGPTHHLYQDVQLRITLILWAAAVVTIALST